MALDLTEKFLITSKCIKTAKRRLKNRFVTQLLCNVCVFMIFFLKTFFKVDEKSISGKQTSLNSILGGRGRRRAMHIEGLRASSRLI